MICDRVTADYAFVALSDEDLTDLILALDSYSIDLAQLRGTRAINLEERLAMCETLSTAFSLMQDLIERGGDGQVGPDPFPAAAD